MKAFSIAISMTLVAVGALTGCTKDSPAPRPSPVADASPSQATSVDAREVVKNGCLSCHTDEMLAQQRLTETQWSKVVTKMVSWGANVEPAETAPLVAYLAAAYGPDAGPYPLPVIDADEASRAIAAQPETTPAGDAAHGKALYVDKCSGCHGPEARGHIGVNLVDRPFLYRAGDFAAVVRRGRGKMTPIPMSDADIADVLTHLRSLR